MNTPVGMNFVAVAYGFSTGNVLLDPSIPIEGAEATLHIVVGRYVRSIDFFGLHGKIRVAVPTTFGDWHGVLEGEQRERQIDGFGDLRLGLVVDFIGAPALDRRGFAEYERSGWVAGAAVDVIVPTGQYDSSRLLNLSSNRWTVIPQLGASREFGKWAIEAQARAWIFGANRDFVGGNTFEQRPLFALQLHGVHTWRPGLWLAAGVAVGNGGRSVVNGVPRDTLQQNSRLGAVFVYPLAARHGLRVSVGTSLTTTTGSDYDTFAVAWQYAWGGR